MNNVEKKLVTVHTYGKIPELGNICGPVIKPHEVDIKSIIRLINRGIKVCEISPYNKNESVVLTRENVNSTNFSKPVKTVEVPETGTTPEEQPQPTSYNDKKSKNGKVVKSDF